MITLRYIHGLLDMYVCVCARVKLLLIKYEWVLNKQINRNCVLRIESTLKSQTFSLACRKVSQVLYIARSFKQM